MQRSVYVNEAICFRNFLKASKQFTLGINLKDFSAHWIGAPE